MRALIIFIYGGLLWLNLLMGCSRTEQSKLLKLEQSAKSIQAIIQIDNVRRNTCRKVLQIIARHNPEMPAGLKKEIANEIYTMSQKYPNLDVDLICATITHESARTWDPKVVSKAGALGLMQVMPGTGEWLAKYEAISWTSAEDILCNPIYNIRIGARYLSA
ncbi:MAG: transglycosylase SLT domain-containing protein, partial [bacterium]